MPAAVGYTPHCRFHRHIRAAGVNCLPKPCSVVPCVWRGHNKPWKHCSNKPRKTAGCASSHQAPLEDTQSVRNSYATPVCPRGYQIRRAKPDEADQVAELNAEVPQSTKSACISVSCVHVCSLLAYQIAQAVNQKSMSLFKISVAHIPGLCMAGIQGHEPWSVETIH